MNAILHPILDTIRDNFSEVNFSNDNIIAHFELPMNTSFEKYFGNIDWSSIIKSTTVDWGELYSNDLMNKLKNSTLSNYESIYLQIGYDEPILELPTLLLIEFWEEILHASVQGFPIITTDGRYFFEMLYTPKLIYSNFKI